MPSARLKPVRLGKASIIAIVAPTVALWIIIAGMAASSVAATGPSTPLLSSVQTPTGKFVTPLAADGAIFQELNPRLADAQERRVGGAAAISISPNGAKLAILTSGFSAYFDGEGRVIPDASTEFVFVFDIRGNVPKQLQALPLKNSYQGISWGPSSDRLFVSGGKDDAVVEFIGADDAFRRGRTIQLGHKGCLGAKPDLYCGPVAGGIAASPDGTRLLVTNVQNDTVSLIDVASGTVVDEQDLRPGIVIPNRGGDPGGSYPRAVVWASSHRAYVASARDREIISLEVSREKMRVLGRMPVLGQPSAIITNGGGSRLYVALDTTGLVAIFDTTRDALLETVDAVAPVGVYANGQILGGANSNALALAPNGRILLVTNGGQNSLAVLRLSDRAMGIEPRPKAGSAKPQREGHGRDDDADFKSATVGLVPTGWYPAGVATSRDGATWYVVNGKSPPGPNSNWCKTGQEQYCDPLVVAPTAPLFAENGITALLAKNDQVNQAEKSGFLAIPAPTPLELVRLTRQVAHNNNLDRPAKDVADEELFSFLRQHIKHVIYIMKENRSYDQVLGDLDIGNGDSRLTLFPNPITPNHHLIARNFVTLDNLLVSAEGSMTGRDWTFAAQTNDMEERNDPLFLSTFYKGEYGGFPYGSDRSADTAHPTSKQRNQIDPDHTSDPDILPGTNRIYGVDGPGGEAGAGYIWDVALRAGLTVRNYGLFEDINKYAPVRDPRASGFKVEAATTPSLTNNSDPYYIMNSNVPDYWRYLEWRREFAEFVVRKSAPNLVLLYLFMDHFGDFDTAIDGVNTPETQMADNDYALGLIIETVANSLFASDTLIISVEDDPSDGPDHVDAFRSIALIAGPYVRQHALVSTRYTTVSLVKTIEEILGIGPIGLNDALAAPMSDVFDPNQTSWSYKAIVPDVLRSTKLPLPPVDHASIAVPAHSAAYWTHAMAGQDFSGPDRAEPVAFNRALWRGLKGDAPYPAVRPSDAGQGR